MIAVITGTVVSLEPEGVRLRIDSGRVLLVTAQIAGDAAGLVVGDRLTVYGGPDPRRDGVWLSSSAHLANEGEPALDVPLTELAWTLTRERLARGEPTIFTRAAK